jgi:DNA-binding transcriptional ArsR family regulator
MKESQALEAFAALSQETRLRIVRLLVKAGPEGLSAGMVADAMGVSGSNVSFHLSQLEHAGLLESRRESRSIIYTAVYPALADLIEFLTKDCCEGRPEVCLPVAKCVPKLRKTRKLALHD